MRRVYLALFVLALVGVRVGEAGAGRIIAFGAGGDATTVGSNTCTRTLNRGTTYAYTTVNCTDGSGGRFEIPAAFPGDSGNSWTYRINYTTPDDAGDKVCAWTVTAIALPNEADVQGFGSAGTVDVAGTLQTHVAGYLYTTPVSAGQTVWNGESNAGCNGTTCQNKPVRLIIDLQTGTTTASSCNFHSIEIIY